MADKTMTEKQQEALNEASKRTAAAVEEAKKRGEAAVDAREEAKQKQNADYYEREASSQPTPTQRENDLAKVGALNVDEKEDDGSEWDDEHQRRVAVERLNNPYTAATAETDESRSGKSKEK